MQQNQTMGERIKELRNIMGMNQTEFSELINGTQAMLSSYENDSKRPSLDTLLVIAEKCDVSMDWLCGLSSKKHKQLTMPTFADIFEVLVEISKTINIDVRIHEENPDPYNFNSIVKHYTLEFNDEISKNFIKVWDKIKCLYDDKSIDTDTYNSIMQGIIQNQDYSISVYNEFDSEDEDLIF